MKLSFLIQKNIRSEEIGSSYLHAEVCGGTEGNQLLLYDPNTEKHCEM